MYSTCLYYSAAKREACTMPRGHAERHFQNLTNSGGDPGGPFSAKKQAQSDYAAMWRTKKKK